MQTDYIRNQSRARNAQLALLVLAGIELLYVVLYVWTQPVLNDFMGNDEAVLSQSFYTMISASMACLLGYLVCMVFFLLWWARANANLKRLGHAIYPNESYAVVCWFIPIGAWIEPWRLYQQMAARYVDVQRQFPQHKLANAPDLADLLRIGGVWWASFVLVGVVDFILILRGEIVATQLIPMTLPPWVNLLPGILAILMIRQFNRVEEAVARAVASGDYAAHIERLDVAQAAQAIEQGEGIAEWRKAEAKDQAADTEDPFSA